MEQGKGQAAPGWYPDPQGASGQRYFDGNAWTDQYQDQAGAMAGAGAAQAPVSYGSAQGQYQGEPQAALNPIEYWKKVYLENYANFSGRARRAEYWWSYLVTVGILVGIAIIGVILANLSSALGTIVGILLGLAYLAAIVPFVAVGIRRLHDTNKSGWFMIMAFIPIASIVLLVFMVTDSDRGPNQYGPSPKY